MKRTLLPLILVTLLAACSGGKKKEQPVVDPTTPTSSVEPTSESITESSPTSEPTTEPIVIPTESEEPTTEPTISPEVTPTETEPTTKEETILLNFYEEDTSGNDVLTYAFDQQSNCEKFIQDQNNILTDVTCVGYAQINYVGSKGDPDRFAVMILGSSKSNGSLTFTSSASITNIKASVRTYTKLYNNAWHPEDSIFYLDDVEQSLTADETSDSELSLVEKVYGEGTKSFTIGTKDNRIFVHSLEITYIVE